MAAEPVSPGRLPCPDTGPFTDIAGRQTMVRELADMELSLRAVLRDANPAALGFFPENVPDTVRVTLPVALISTQLAMGRVVLNIDQICAGISEKFRPVFARATPGLQITVPLSEVFQNLPESAKPVLPPAPPAPQLDEAPEEAHRFITTRLFETPFAIKAEEDSTKQLLNLSATGFDKSNALQVRPNTQPVVTVELPPAGGPLAGRVDSNPLRPAVASRALGPESSPMTLPRPGVLSRPPGSVTAPLPPPTRHAPTLAPASPRAVFSTLPSASAPETLPPDDLGETFSAARLGTEPPPRAGSAPVGLPALPLPPPAAPLSAEPRAAPAPVAEAAGTNPDPVSLLPVPALTIPAPDPATVFPPEGLTFGFVQDSRQLTLRALFSTDQRLTPQDIVNHCATLPGLKACALFRGNLTLISDGMDGPEARTFESSASKTCQSLSALADSLGLGAGGNFTLRTDHGVRSFFFEPGLCLAVWHAEPSFAGGMREKLILTARELAKP